MSRLRRLTATSRIAARRAFTQLLAGTGDPVAAWALGHPATFRNGEVRGARAGNVVAPVPALTH